MAVAKAAESRTLEYKQEIELDSKGGKRELCTDIAAFANATGGLLLVGIRSGKDAEQGIAMEVVGIATTKTDALTLQISQILHDGISPRLNVGVRSIPLANGKVVIAIKIQRSSIGPHAAGRDGKFSFFTGTAAAPRGPVP